MGEGEAGLLNVEIGDMGARTNRNNYRSYYTLLIPIAIRLKIYVFTTSFSSTQWRSWFRHYATSRKVAVSIPDGVGIFH